MLRDGKSPGRGHRETPNTTDMASVALVGKLAAEVPLSEIAKLFVGTS